MPLVEQLGSFYLGKEYDMKDRQALDRPVNYDSRDLVTHAICVGMTGCGGKHRATARTCAQVRYHGSPGLARLAADLPGRRRPCGPADCARLSGRNRWRTERLTHICRAGP